MKYIASVSWGKDSLAMLIRLINESRPLDEVTYFCKKDMEIWISSIPHFWILGWC